MDSGAIMFERQVAAFFFDQHRHGTERLENFLHRDRTRAGTAAAVRRGKCFVQIEVHHVDAEISGARDAGKRVHVRAVHVKQRACACRMSAISAMRSSKMPSVEGLVIISAATSSVTSSRSLSTSIWPCDSDLMFSTS